MLDRNPMNYMVKIRRHGSSPAAPVRWRSMTLAVPVLVLGLSHTAMASPLDKPDDQRVRAETATVMTVEATSTQVETQGKSSRSDLAKKKHRFGFGPLKVWNSLIDATGKMMYVDQVVPSGREREVRQKDDQ